MTNREFAATDVVFQAACLAAGLPFAKKPKGKRPIDKPQTGHDLKRQASKWRRGRGLAWKSRPIPGGSAEDSAITHKTPQS